MIVDKVVFAVMINVVLLVGLNGVTRANNTTVSNSGKVLILHSTVYYKLKVVNVLCPDNPQQLIMFYYF